PDPLEATARYVVESFEREREVRAASILDQSVDLIDDDGSSRAQHSPSPLRRQQEIKGLRCGDEYVWRLAEHGGAGGRRRVPGANGGSDPNRRESRLAREAAYRPTWLREIPMDVGREGLERGDVHDPNFVRKVPMI